MNPNLIELARLTGDPAIIPIPPLEFLLEKIQKFRSKNPSYGIWSARSNIIRPEQYEAIRQYWNGNQANPYHQYCYTNHLQFRPGFKPDLKHYILVFEASNDAMIGIVDRFQTSIYDIDKLIKSNTQVLFELCWVRDVEGNQLQDSHACNLKATDDYFTKYFELLNVRP
jgi:hypothetical protein